MADSYRTGSSSPRRTSQTRVRPIRHVAWGSILAGTLIAIMVQLLINLLVVGLGLQAINPASQQEPFAGVGTGAAIGIILSTVVSLFAGGWVASHLAGTTRTFDSVLHGILTWGLVTLLTLMLLTTAVGQLVGGVTSLVGQGLGAAGQGAAAIAPDVAPLVEDALAAQGVPVGQIQQDIEELTTDPESQEALNEVVSRFSDQGAAAAQGESRQELVTLLTEQTELNEAEAEESLDRWAASYQDAEEAVAGVQDDAAVVAEDTTDAVGTGALWASLGLLLGAVVAAVGGLVGRPKELDDVAAAL